MPPPIKELMDPTSNLIDQVDQQILRENLLYLCKDPLPVRKLNYTLPGHSKSTLDEADDFIVSKLQSYGYEIKKEPVTVQAFRCDIFKPKSSQYSSPEPEDPWYTAHNLYAKKTGSVHPDEITVVVSHKDSQSWVDSPGANDNGVGTVSNMEIARILSDYDSSRSIWFLYCNEEHRPWTSVTAAERMANAGLNVIAVLNIDSISGKSAAVTDKGLKTNITRYTTDEGEALADRMIELNEKYEIGLHQGKSHLPRPGDDDGSFINAGFPNAILNIGSYPYAEPNYHHESDTFETVDFENVALATQLSMAFVLHVDRNGV